MKARDIVTRYVPTDPRDMRVLDVAPTQFSAELRLAGMSVQDEREGGAAWPAACTTKTGTLA